MNREVGDPLLARARRHGGVPADDWHHDPWDDVAVVGVDDVDEIRDPGRHLVGPLRLLAIVVSAVIVLLGMTGWWVVRQLNPSGEPGAPFNFTVNEGDTVQSVAGRLKSSGVIVNRTVFEWYVRSRGGIALVPGYYSLRTREDAGKVVEALSTPPAQTFVSVTFPEGMTVSQMATRLSEKITFMNPQEFLASTLDGSVGSTLLPKGATNLEGLLFPDTYQVSGDDSEARIVGRLASMMERVGRQVGLGDSGRLVGLSPYKTLIVASMIEREAKVPEDRAKIARVIYNRLAKNMKLEIDATLKYGVDPATPFTELKKRDTPYNTYKYAGLPPTPIANPGRASIVAALSPAAAPKADDEACAGLPRGAECDYFYYVRIDSSGRHAFATTYKQHLANIEKALAAGALP